MASVEYRRGAIDPGECIGGAWNLVTQKFWLYVGAGLVTLLLIGCVPIVSIFLFGPVLGGFYYLVLRDARGEPVDFGMLFKGFERFIPLMAAGIIQSIPGIVWQVVQYASDIARLMRTIRGPENSGDFFAATSSDVVWAGFSLTFVALILGLVLLTIAWSMALSFAIPLLVEHDIGVVDAISLSVNAAVRNAGGLILLIILEMLVALAGVLALCIGIFVAIPVIYAANALAYRQVFPSGRIPATAPAAGISGL